jgi:hypothetical protein
MKANKQLSAISYQPPVKTGGFLFLVVLVW